MYVYWVQKIECGAIKILGWEHTGGGPEYNLSAHDALAEVGLGLVSALMGDLLRTPYMPS